jgi:hypothetical protein
MDVNPQGIEKFVERREPFHPPESFDNFAFVGPFEFLRYCLSPTIGVKYR